MLLSPCHGVRPTVGEAHQTHVSCATRPVTNYMSECTMTCIPASEVPPTSPTEGVTFRQRRLLCRDQWDPWPSWWRGIRIAAGTLN